MIKLDDIDQKFVIDILIKAKAYFQMRMTDPSVCEDNRDRSMELAKIAKKAIDIVRGSNNET